MNSDYITNTSGETREIGKKIASSFKGGEVLCLYGNLGAGKTTFVQGFIDFFIPNKRVLSPTFIIVRHYKTTRKNISGIYHADLYRIESYEEIEGVGLFEFMNKPENIVLIEWAEKLGEHKPEPRVDINIEILGEEKRKISINSKSK